MSVPLTVAAPAAAAALAYVNAKASIWYDLRLLKAAGITIARLFSRRRAGRLNVFYALEGHATDPSRTAKDLIIFEGRRHSYADVYDKVLRYGAWLKDEFGVKPKDIVAMDFQNSDTFIFIWFALWSIGAKPAFLNYNLTGNALAHCIKEATTKLCLVDPAVASHVQDDVRKQVPDVRFVVFTPDVEAEASATPPTRSPDQDRSEEDPAQMAMLIYTSGTTGLPKPAIVSWTKCIAGASMGEKVIGIDPQDIMYTAMPLYHSSAAILSFLCMLHAGGTQALGRKFSTKNFWNDVRASNATAIQYVGETLRYLLAAPPQRDPATGDDLDKRHRVRLAYGNGLRPDVWNRFKERFGIETIAEMYSATESTFSTINISANDFSAGAIGRSGWLYGALMGRRTALVEVDWATEKPARDPETGFCKKVAQGQPGEILAALPEDIQQRFQGYYNNPGATEKKIMRDVFKKGDAWFRSGDVVRWDRDGRVFFNDRIGDTFRWKSENVSTAEVSEAVGTHPAVHEANVYGVKLPNHDGRAGCAAVYLAAGQGRNLDDTLRSLAAHVRASLPRYAVPLFLRVAEGDPGATRTTGTNKQQKHLLREAGVKPDAAKDADMGALYWLGRDTYVPFREREWAELEGGRVKL